MWHVIHIWLLCVLAYTCFMNWQHVLNKCVYYPREPWLGSYFLREPWMGPYFLREPWTVPPLYDPHYTPAFIPNILNSEICHYFHEENEVSFTDHEENIYEITDHDSIHITIAITSHGHMFEQITDQENTPCGQPSLIYPDAFQSWWYLVTGLSESNL